MNERENVFWRKFDVAKNSVLSDTTQNSGVSRGSKPFYLWLKRSPCALWLVHFVTPPTSSLQPRVNLNSVQNQVLLTENTYLLCMFMSEQACYFVTRNLSYQSGSMPNQLRALWCVFGCVDVCRSQV